jgi:hypothetical protein
MYRCTTGQIEICKSSWHLVGCRASTHRLKDCLWRREHMTRWDASAAAAAAHGSARTVYRNRHLIDYIIIISVQSINNGNVPENPKVTAINMQITTTDLVSVDWSLSNSAFLAMATNSFQDDEPTKRTPPVHGDCSPPEWIAGDINKIAETPRHESKSTTTTTTIVLVPGSIILDKKLVSTGCSITGPFGIQFIHDWVRILRWTPHLVDPFTLQIGCIAHLLFTLLSCWTVDNKSLGNHHWFYAVGGGGGILVLGTNHCSTHASWTC